MLSGGGNREKMGRFLLIIILIFVGTAHCAVPTYGIRPLAEKEYSEDVVNKEIAEVAHEKEKIMESVAPIRAEREKQLHPFVEPIKYEPTAKDNAQPFQYTAAQRAPQEPEKVTQNVKPAYSKPASKPGINFTFLSLIAIAFLLSYFFIRPKSR